ncbi:transposase [Collinsella aerofaciens]|jgi:transposase|uniref:transposase n=1 Tax=Collinsella aerofaciens TaxID=74426 RepID=UPI001368B22E|nr:transposase [Collinsella sp.]MZJ34795.1 transposase [Collinsella aerofaciens]MZJ36821.1 transposase [Collinsella aerofaciens]MZJ40617.1 transposase [Collinsella aerofaciens]MZJ42405.1 transposase [Collinsella aerofaciens]
MQNESIPDARGPVFCGVDTHADSHWLYVLDWRGRKVLSRQFPADAAGYEALAGAIAAAGEPACIAMEGTSSYGAGLNPGRLRSEASFAAICGACPIPASSGKTVRHRLNRGGDRQANSALHEIARQRVMRDPETAEYAERARGRGKSDREVMRCLKRYVAREAYRALMRPHEIRRPEDASELVAARRAAKVSQVRAASILGTSEKYISMLERGQRELKPIRRAYEAWVEAGLPLDWDRQAFEAERKMDSKKHLAK